MGAACVTGGAARGGDGEGAPEVTARGDGSSSKGKGTWRKALDDEEASAAGSRPDGEEVGLAPPSDQPHVGVSSKPGGEMSSGIQAPRRPPAADARDPVAEHRAFLQREGTSTPSGKTRKGKRRGSMNREKPSVWGAAERAAYEAEQQGTAPASLTTRLSNNFVAMVGAKRGEEAVVAQQKQLCSVCAQWLPNDCTCGDVVENEKWISSDSDDDDEESRNLTVKEREKLRRKKKDKGKVTMSRGGTRVKAQRSIQDIRAQAQEREHEAALLYNKSSAAANALGTPAGPKVAVNPHPRLVEAMDKKKKKAAQEGGGGEFRLPPSAPKDEAKGQGTRRSKLQPGMLGGSQSALTYKRPKTPPGGWASKNTFKIPPRSPADAGSEDGSLG